MASSSLGEGKHEHIGPWNKITLISIHQKSVKGVQKKTTRLISIESQPKKIVVVVVHVVVVVIPVVDPRNIPLKFG